MTTTMIGPHEGHRPPIAEHAKNGNSTTLSSSSSSSLSLYSSSSSSSPYSSSSSTSLYASLLNSISYPSLRFSAPQPFVYEPTYIPPPELTSSPAIPEPTLVAAEGVSVETQAVEPDELLSPLSLMQKGKKNTPHSVDAQEQDPILEQLISSLQAPLIVVDRDSNLFDNFKGFHPYHAKEDHAIHSSVMKLAEHFKAATQSLPLRQKIRYAQQIATACGKAVALGEEKPTRRILIARAVSFHLGTSLLEEVLDKPARPADKLQLLGLLYQQLTSEDIFLLPKAVFATLYDFRKGIPEFTRDIALSFQVPATTELALLAGRKLIGKILAQLPQETLFTSMVTVALQDDLAKKIIRTLGNTNKDSYLRTGELCSDVDHNLGKIIAFLVPQNAKEEALMKTLQHACKPIPLLLGIVFEDPNFAENAAPTKEKADSAAITAHAAIKGKRQKEFRVGQALKYPFRPTQTQQHTAIEKIRRKKEWSIAWGVAQSHQSTALSYPIIVPLTPPALIEGVPAKTLTLEPLSLTPTPPAVSSPLAVKDLVLEPILLSQPVYVAPSSSNPPLPISSYLQLAFPHFVGKANDDLWLSLSDSGKKDALRHINVHSYLIDKNPELFVIENKIKQWLKSKHGELFFLQTKGEIEKLHPSISDGRELSPLKVARGEAILNHYYNESPSNPEYYTRLFSLLAQFPKEDSGDLFFYFYEQARQSGWKDFGESWGEKNYLNHALYLLAVQALERYLHTK